MELDVLAIGAHPDDVELGCGGTLALLAQAGRKVGILHLTAGERGTRGTPDERRAEAQEAGKALGVVEVGFLDCGDGGLRRSEVEEDAVIERLRRARPEIVLAPSPRDRHPDHGRAYRLVVDACFYAGLAGRAPEQKLSPHRPAAVFSYMQHDPFEPSFIVDVTATWEIKKRALAAYKSQLHQPDRPREVEEPSTKVSSPEFALAVEGRARHFGLLIGSTYGEPFRSELPLAVADPWSILPRGLR